MTTSDVSTPLDVAVVIPCKDAARWIGPTLTSLLNQTSPAAEIVVADDGSTDDSRDIVGRHPEVRLLTGPFGSAAATRTAGLDETSSPAVMFLDADDLLSRDALHHLRSALPSDGIARCDWRRYELDGEAWVVRPQSCAPRAPWQDDLDAWLTGWYSPPCSLLWSRQAIEAAGGWRTSLANDDGDLMMRALTQGHELRAAAGGLAFYRRVPNPEASQSGQRFTATGLTDRIDVIEGVAERLVESGDHERYQTALATAFEQLAHDARTGVAALTAQHDERERSGRLAQLERAERNDENWGTGRRRVLTSSAFGRSTTHALARTATNVLDRIVRRRDDGRWPTLSSAASPTMSSPAWPTTRGLVSTDDDAAPGAAHIRPRLRDPLVSVVLPTFNRPDQTARAIASVLAQTYAHLELIVVDDASTDETPESVGGFRDARLRLLRQPMNQGVAAARNRGMRVARGELIALLDSDDRWHERKLEAQLDALAHSPRSTGLVYTGVTEVADDADSTNVDGAQSSVEFARSGERELVRGDLFAALLERNVLHGGGSTVLVTRTVIETVGGFDETMTAVEDWDFWLRVARLFTVEVVPEALVVLDSGTDRPRRSRAFDANMAAWRDMYHRYRDDMRAAGCEQRFLMELARRNLEQSSGSAWNGRKHVLQALAADPLTPTIYPWLGYMLLPPRGRARLRALDNRSEPRRV